MTGALLWAHNRYGSVAVAAARGEPVVATPGELSLGTVAAGAEVERRLRVVNLSAGPVDVVLAQSSCSCAEVAGLPVTIPPGEAVELSVLVTVSRASGPFRRVGRLRTTAGDVEYSITARVTGGSDGEQSRGTRVQEGQQ